MGKDDDNHGKPDYVEPEEAGRFEKPLTLTPLKSSIEPLVLTQRSRVEDLGAPTVVLDRHKTPVITLLDNIPPISKEELERQYSDEINVLAHYGLVGKNGEARPGDAPLPASETVLESFTEEERKLATTLTNPLLTLAPEISFVALKQIVEEHIKQIDMRMRFQEGLSYIISLHEGLFEQQDPTSNAGANIMGWRALITGDPVSEETEDPGMKSKVLKRSYRDKMNDWKNRRHKCVQGVNRNDALWYLLKKINRRENPIPTKSHVILLDKEFPTNEDILGLAEQLKVDIDDIQLPSIKLMTYKRLAGGVFFGSADCFDEDGELYDTLFVPVIGGNKILK